MKPQLYRLTPYRPGKRIEEVKAELGLAQVVKLASNENPFGTSPKVGPAIQEVLKTLALYPDGHASALRAALADRLDIDPERLIFGNGTDELLHLFSRSVLSPGLNSVMAHPTFPNYKRNAIIDGAEVREIPLKNGRHDLDSMLEAIDENTGIVWLCNPNNPTGEYIREKELIDFLEQVPENTFVVCDEAYYEYVTADDFPNTIALMDRYPNLIVTRTFSKVYGLAALRIGYAIAQPAVIRALEAAREPFNVSAVAQAAALAALEDQAFVSESIRRNREGLETYYQFCDEAGLSYYRSQGNFILIQFSCSGDAVFDYLLKRGQIVRAGTALGVPNAVRITIGTREQNLGVIEGLKQFIKEHTQV